MAQCPDCYNEVGDDFGLINCSKCGASLFVDMEGNVISGQESEAESFESEPADPVESELVSDAEEQDEISFGEMSAVQSLDEPVESDEPPAMEEYPEGSVVSEMNFENSEEAKAETPTYESVPTSSDFKDVMDFANSDVSQGHDGSLKYQLIISGIDTLDLRNEVKESLTDKRFIWDIDAIIRGIQNGVLELDQVSAVKAFVIVSRMAHLPVQIEWVQQPLNQP